MGGNCQNCQGQRDVALHRGWCFGPFEGCIEILPGDRGGIFGIPAPATRTQP